MAQRLWEVPTRTHLRSVVTVSRLAFNLEHVEAERSEVPQKGHAGEAVYTRTQSTPMVVTLFGMVTLVRLLP